LKDKKRVHRKDKAKSASMSRGGKEESLDGVQLARRSCSGVVKRNQAFPFTKKKKESRRKGRYSREKEFRKSNLTKGASKRELMHILGLDGKEELREPFGEKKRSKRLNPL